LTLVRDPGKLPEGVLQELLRALLVDLEETEALVRLPPERVRDPASIETASDLLRSTRTALARPSAGASPEELAARANLAYAVLLAVIDLVKSHSDLPKVPVPRARGPPPGTG
jgi:hypothetical protein